MQTAAVKELRATWLAKAASYPTIVCEHPTLDKEYYLSSDTGDYVCMDCGETGWGRNWPANERAERRATDGDS